MATRRKNEPIEYHHEFGETLKVFKERIQKTLTKWSPHLQKTGPDCKQLLKLLDAINETKNLFDNRLNRNFGPQDTLRVYYGPVDRPRDPLTEPHD